MTSYWDYIYSIFLINTVYMATSELCALVRPDWVPGNPPPLVDWINQAVSDLSNREFAQFANTIRDIDRQIIELLQWREGYVGKVWQLKFALLQEEVTQETRLQESNVYNRLVEDEKKKSLQAETLLIQSVHKSTWSIVSALVPEIWDAIMTHSRNIQLKLVPDLATIAEYQANWSTEQLLNQTRELIARVDESLLRLVVGRVSEFYKYSGVLSEKQASSLLPQVPTHYETVFEKITLASSQVRWSKWILNGNNAW